MKIKIGQQYRDYACETVLTVTAVSKRGVVLKDRNGDGEYLTREQFNRYEDTGIFREIKKETVQ